MRGYVYEHQEELGFSGAGGFNADCDVVGFRQKDGRRLGLLPAIPQNGTADSDAYGIC